MTEHSGAAAKLSVRTILRDTFLIPGQHRREFLKPLALPGLLIAVLSMGEEKWSIERVD